LDKNLFHVIPCEDLIEHVLDDDTCVCGPTMIWDDGEGGTLSDPVVVHHSLDGRERYEAGTSKS